MLTLNWASKDAKLVASSIEQATNEQGKLVNAAIVHFTDGSKALVGAKHFKGITPKFLTEELELLTTEFVISRINGQPWIVEKTNTSHIKL
jgi:hypothetical protein